MCLKKVSSIIILIVAYQLSVAGFSTGLCIAHQPCHDNDLDHAVQLLKFLNSSHPDSVLQSIFMGTNVDVESALYLSEQSAGFKQLNNMQPEEFHTFLELTLHSSHRKRSRLIERLVNIAKLSSLTPKEVAVMVQVLNGFANKEIALQMGNSSRTIELHRASLFEKMDVKNAIELSMLLHNAMRS